MKRILIAAVLLMLVLALPACESAIRPLQPIKRVELWIPDDGSPAIQLSQLTPVAPIEPAAAPATQSTSVPVPVYPADVNAASSPTTMAAATELTPGPPPAPASAPAPTTAPATNPKEVAFAAPTTLPAGHKVIKIIDPNQTARFVYNASYDNVWQQSLLLVHKLGFTLNQTDYRLGVLTTQPLPSAQIIEFWKEQHSSALNAAENTLNSQRRHLRLIISKVPAKPKFYEIAVQVIVEREINPSEELTGPLFIEGSGFGRNAVALRSDYADASSTMNPKKAALQEPVRLWVILGHDPTLEKKILDELFGRI